jgi:3-deoxy-7-phosphoheptulonate synthase
MKTDDLRIRRTRPLLTPAILAEEIPVTDDVARLVSGSRRALEDILDGRDRRRFVVVGPCSIHDPEAAREYAQRLKAVADQVAERLMVVMRVYFEKPRTVMGWKGLIHDPGIDGSFQINRGLRLARRVLADVAEIGLPAGTEFLDTTFGQFYTDLVAWGAIGARTAESQVHRELASGLSMPVGIKNRTDGNTQIAVDALLAAREPHLFPSLTKEGAPAILETTGNPYCHVVLRGGTETGPNFTAPAVQAVLERLQRAGLPSRLMIDCSHGNSGRDPLRQLDVLEAAAEQLRAGQDAIRGVMLESHLEAGRQEPDTRPLRYGVSITDACLGFGETRDALLRLAETIGAVDRR